MKFYGWLVPFSHLSTFNGPVWILKLSIGNKNTIPKLSFKPTTLKWGENGINNCIGIDNNCNVVFSIKHNNRFTICLRLLLFSAWMCNNHPFMLHPANCFIYFCSQSSQRLGLQLLLNWCCWTYYVAILADFIFLNFKKLNLLEIQLFKKSNF